MTLDQIGKISAAEIAFYTPVLCIAFITALKHGFSRRLGWVFLFTFSLIRFVGAIITVVSKSTSSPQIGLIIASTVLSGIALSPLLLATQGFVNQIAERRFPPSARPLRVARLLLFAALILSAAGGSLISPSNSSAMLSTGRTLARVSVLLYLVSFLILAALHVPLWRIRHDLPPHHRNLLCGVSLALAPLFVRILYALLGVFASSLRSRWSSLNGDWKLYLFMGLIAEYLVVLVYIITGFLTPLRKDEEAEMPQIY